MNNFNQTIIEIFNYTYGSTDIRLPEEACFEVCKIIESAIYIESLNKSKEAFNVDSKDISLLDGNKSLIADRWADKVRIAYKKSCLSQKKIFSEIKFKDNEIGKIIGLLANIKFSEFDFDPIGDTLEIFRSKWSKQEGGQFFTDQLVTTLAIKLLELEKSSQKELLDICAGTGGFLMAALKDTFKKSQSIKANELKKLGLKLIGIEIDQSVAEMGNTTLSVSFPKIQKEFIKSFNSLDLKNLPIFDDRIKMGEHKFIATNPPFGSKITIKDSSILDQYQLARVSGCSSNNLRYRNKGFYKRAPDVLFLEANIRLLEPGIGRMAIVTPYQILSGPQTYYVRNWLLCNCFIEAVVDLPSETFQPHTGTKTSLLVLRKRKNPLSNINEILKEDFNRKIFMSLPRNIGHDRRGNKIYESDTKSGNKRKIKTDFHRLIEAFKAYKNNQNFNNIHKETFTIDHREILKDDLLRINAANYSPDLNKKLITSITENSVKLSKVVDSVFCPGRFKRNYVEKSDNAVPFLGGADINQMIYETGKWLSKNDPKLPKLKVNANWILITRSGTTGIISSVPEVWEGFAISEHVIRVIPNDSLLPSGYLMSYLKTQHCQNELKKSIFGSVIDEISIETILDLDIPLLELPIMKKIDSISKDALLERSQSIQKLKESKNIFDSILINNSLTKQAA